MSKQAFRRLLIAMSSFILIAGSDVSSASTYLIGSGSFSNFSGSSFQVSGPIDSPVTATLSLAVQYTPGPYVLEDPYTADPYTAFWVEGFDFTSGAGIGTCFSGSGPSCSTGLLFFNPDFIVTSNSQIFGIYSEELAINMLQLNYQYFVTLPDNLSITPLPGALILFTSGLGALSFFAWIRKWRYQKTQAATLGLIIFAGLVLPSCFTWCGGLA